MASEEDRKGLFQNWLSIIGAIGSIFLFSIILFLIILDFFAIRENPYVLSITFVILPIFLVFFLFLIPIGILRERKRRHEKGYVRRFPQVDFNHPVHQKWAFVFISVITLFVLFSMYGTYRAYHFTESVQFCGKVCHQVMHPEHSSYLHSPHARVACTECHVGEGAEWYLKSKFEGMHQIYASLSGSYSKPIETPVKNLRPAEQTCELCHWPEQFYGAVQEQRQYFLSDEANTPWNSRMLLFVGGGIPPFGKGEGIHWHMNIKHKVYYIPSDDKREKIPWVKVVDPEGKETVYVDKESKFTAEKPPEKPMRLMDCIDCHNRPTHIYKAPAEAVNQAMSIGEINATLPFMKREAVKVLSKDYDSKEKAKKEIESQMKDFYQKKYPEILDQKQKEIEKSIEGILKIYDHNFFPEMKVSWKAYPDHIGHLISPGCFRCHDGKHVSEDGRVVTNNCMSCHITIAQGPPNALESSVDGLEFKHPDGDDETWKEMTCSDCHTGGPV